MVEKLNNSTREGSKYNEEPYCIGNYCDKHDSCQKCHFKAICMKIPLPKEPLWCNNLI